jgi:hypothetical protein
MHIFIKHRDSLRGTLRVISKKVWSFLRGDIVVGARDLFLGGLREYFSICGRQKHNLLFRNRDSFSGSDNISDTW